MKYRNGVLLLIVLLVIVPTVLAQRGGHVQRDIVIGTGDLSDNITIQHVNNSFVLFRSRAGASGPDDWQFLPRIVNTSTVQFFRFDGAGSSATLAWEVVESDDIYTQSGILNLAAGNASANVTLNSIQLNKSFVIVYGACSNNGGTTSNAGFFAANLTNTTNLHLRRGNEGDCQANVSYQVVQWSAANTLTGQQDIPSNQDDITPAVNNVPLNSTFLSFSTASPGTDPGMDSNLIQGTITNSNLLTFTKEPGNNLANSDRNVWWWTVEIPWSVVRTGTTALAADTNQAVNGVNLSRTFHITSMWNTGGGQTYANSFFDSNLSRSDNLFFDKQTGSQTSNIRWYLIELPLPDPQPDFSGFNVSPANNSVYTPPTTQYQFNVTVNDTNDSVGLEFGGVNYTATNVSGTFVVNLTDLAAGNYTYYWWAFGRGLDEPYNASSTFLYVLEKANSSISAFVNNSQSNLTLERGISVNLSSILNTGFGFIQLYNNSILINNGTSPISNFTDFNEEGFFNITGIYEGNENYTNDSDSWFITVNDTILPNITNVVNSSITDKAALITWNTDEAANSSVRYGENLSFVNQTISTSFVTSHNILLINLTPNTTYFYNVTSCDPYGNCASNFTFNFTTLTAPDLDAPDIFKVIVYDITETFANITWDTDENANSTVFYWNISNITQNTSSATYVLNHSVLLTGLEPLTTYWFNVSSCDPSNNCNMTGIYNFTTIDITSPQGSNNNTDPLTGVTYSHGANYQFNVTWTDNVQVDTVWIEHDFTGTLINYSITGNDGDVYYYNYSDLAAGNYVWRMYANDTVNNVNQTKQYPFVVNQIQSIINLSINGSESNLFLTNTTSINISANLTTPTGWFIQLFRTGSLIASGNAPIWSNETFSVEGIYNITASFGGDKNHSSASKTFFVTLASQPVAKPTNVIAEQDIGTMGAGTATATYDLDYTYNLTKTFMKVHHMTFGTAGVTPDDSSVSVRFLNGSRIEMERYASDTTVDVSYSILQADNIYVWNWTNSWAAADENDDVTLSPALPSDYASKCFVETHRNMRINTATLSDFTEQEVRTTITNRTNLNLVRDTEGANVATVGVQHGFVVCFLDTTSVETGAFSISGDVGSVESETISAVDRTRSFSVINYYQADDGVGQNNIMSNITDSTTLRVRRDEVGTSQNAVGTYYVIEHEGNSGGNVQHIDYRATDAGAALNYTTAAFTVVQPNRTFLNCENTMANGGGTAHTRGYFVFNFNAAADAVKLGEGRDRGGGQFSRIMCQVNTWPNITTFTDIPNFLNLQEIPANASDYVYNNTYTFSSTVLYTNGTVGFSFNGVNYTPTNNSNVYSVSITDLSAGNYTYYWWAYGLDYANPFNTSETILYNVARISPNVSTYVNNTRNNITIERTSTIYLNGSLEVGEGTIELYNDGSLINSGNSPLANLTLFNDVGSFNVSTVHPETDNYTLGIETWWVTVEDTISPNITNVVNSSITDTVALITWNTDEVANSSVQYGENLSFVNQTISAGFVTAHNILLINLTPNTTYFYNVTSCDPYGNCASNFTFNFTTLATPDVTPPKIFKVIVYDIGETTANITWDTDENANSTVFYWNITNITQNTSSTSYVVNHTVLLTGLEPLTTYWFNVSSCDPSNNCNMTGIYNFTTIDISAPKWSNINVSPPNLTAYMQNTNFQFNVTWTDNVVVDTVWIEHNFSGALTNYSITANVGSEYYYNFSDLHGGEFFWRMYANDSENNVNVTDNQSYFVDKLNSTINLSINGTQDNFTIQEDQFVTINGTLSVPDDGFLYIYRDGSLIASGNANLTHNESFSISGTFNITLRYFGNDNYSESSVTYFVTALEIRNQAPTNVQAEQGSAFLPIGTTLVQVNLTNTYDLSKAFLKTYHMTIGTAGQTPDDSAISVRFINTTTLEFERYASDTDAHASYSILQADNIQVWNWTNNWAAADENDDVTLSPALPSDYDTKCFVETHRNMRINSPTNTDFGETEVRTTITDTTTLNLQRDTEGANAATVGVEHGFVVCFLDDSTIQTNTFTIAGDVGTEENININSVTTAEAFSVINYYHADDGVGQNALLANFTDGDNLTIHRDEIGGGQTANGRYWVVELENQSNALVQHISYQAPGTGALINYTFGPFNAVDRNKTFLNCENTMANGGGTAHTRGYWVFNFNSTHNGIKADEGRDRADTQFSDIVCQVITWPNITTYLPDPDLIVSNVTFNNNDPIEGENVTVFVNISNVGDQSADNVTIQLNVSYWNGSDWLVRSSYENNVESVNGSDSIISNFYWIAETGPHNFSVVVDIDDVVSEQNESNNNFSINLSVDSWQIFYGFINNKLLILSDDPNARFTLWNNTADEGNVYLMDADANVDFVSLLPLNETGDLDEADTALNISSHNDSISRLYDEDDDNVADNFYTFTIGGTDMDVPIINTTNSSNFITGILWDASLGGSYDGSQLLVFISRINGTMEGRYGSYDYEVRVPSAIMRQTGATEEVAFVLEYL